MGRGRINHGPLPWIGVFDENYENLQNGIFLKTLLLRINHKDLKFALVVELAQLKFTY